MEVLIEKKNVVMDATVLSSVMGCGRLTDFTINRSFIPISGSGNAIECGSLVHKMLETYNYALIHGMDKSAAMLSAFEAGQIYYTHGSETDEPPSSIPMDNQKGEDGKLKYIGYSHIIGTMQEYFDFYKNDSWTPISTEQVVGKVIYEDDEMRLLWKAKLDSLMDTYHGIIPMDHKTMKQRRETMSLNNQFMGQCVVSESNKVCINKIGWQTSLKSADKFQRVLISYSDDRLKEWKDIAAYWAKVYVNYSESDYWPANFTHCDKFAGCIFRGICESERTQRTEELKLHFKVGKKWDVNNNDD